ncbi:MAG: cell division protein FtsL [Burkholderiales bacterium]|nr:MAG: cell division protein FtsL [Burkholderiales bacterium]
MIRLNLVLLLAVLVSAFYLVHTQYESRRLYTALDRAQSQARRLEVEHDQLQVAKRAEAAASRVQLLATRRLQMRPVTPGVTHYVQLPGSASAGPTVPAGARP